jgi:hypothetical protein
MTIWTQIKAIAHRMKVATNREEDTKCFEKIFAMKYNVEKEQIIFCRKGRN